MSNIETMRLALKALEVYWAKAEHRRTREDERQAEDAITAIKAALLSRSDGEAKDEIDWKDMYEKQKRRSEMWVAKYEKDIGPLEKAVPHQEAKNEPVAWMYEVNHAHTCLDLFEPPDDAYDEGTLYPLYTTPPQRKPLTDEEIVAIVRETSRGSAIRRDGSTSLRIARAIEAAHGIKGEA